MRRVLAGEPGPLADITALNAGAALYAGGTVERLEDGVELARTTLASGAGAAKLEALRSFPG
jgi:anthranilate phosphoribosyltransferase